VIALAGVAVRRGGRTILGPVDWTVGAGEHWGVAGPNGAGKTTLLRVVSAQMRPSDGTATVLGGRLGRTPLHALRARIGLVEPALARRFYPQQRAIDVVLTGAHGTILPDQEIPAGTVERARALLAETEAASLERRLFAGCSEGERARILLARALLADADLLVLDEPAAGLDLPGRELLLAALDRVVSLRPALATVTVTHHLEELPAATTHALLLRDGQVVAAGPVAEALTDETLSACFGLPLHVERNAGRLAVRSG
jgi:iron complex transport system ATP-binding protein